MTFNPPPPPSQPKVFYTVPKDINKRAYLYWHENRKRIKKSYWLNRLSTYEERVAAAKDMAAKLQLHIGYESTLQKLRPCIVQYLREKNNMVSEDTMKTYRSVLLLFAAEAGDMTDVNLINKQAVDNFLVSLNVLPQTRNKYQKILMTFFRWAYLKALAFGNPVKGRPLQHHITTSRNRPPSDEDVRKIALLLHEQDPPLELFWSLILYTGLRPAEISRLQCGDIVAGSIYLNATKSKTKTERLIAIPEPLRKILRDHTEIFSSPKTWYVFSSDLEVGPAPNTGARSAMQRRWKNLIKPLVDVDMYSAKHFQAVRLAKAGVPLINLREFTGHKRVSTTEIYLSKYSANEVLLGVLNEPI